MGECCPHCGARLPIVRDACCGECRADLSEPPDDPIAAASVVPPPSAAQTASDHNKALRVAILTSISIYIILISTIIFDRGVEAKAVAAFGRKPLGLPAVLFAGLLQTVLYVPMPRTLYHLALIGEQARRDGRILLGLRAILYIAEVDHRHPNLARSQRICMGGLMYIIAVVAVWVAYNMALGI